MSTELNWFKSSYSSEQGGNCIEVAVVWAKSSYSGDKADACVEVAACPHTVHVRDSKDTALPSLAVTPDSWAAFVAGIDA
ncbi:DUF397 domain-containing protein [Streptomyces sp. P9(2023)]|uniref:DUF397 domain-containing protein n=1 Tax=Streptomyces sp. P9(2023) TaxID=3064394 RepID=UPI0028F43F60|nr:DUF397 domain-containing protein [Streptomyces sp. P9(2023)]MDT9690503.1 DUF397 domain-containing protein [Streptomyces sp. P9(2023)]